MINSLYFIVQFYFFKKLDIRIFVITCIAQEDMLEIMESRDRRGRTSATVNGPIIMHNSATNGCRNRSVEKQRGNVGARILLQCGFSGIGSNAG